MKIAAFLLFIALAYGIFQSLEVDQTNKVWREDLRPITINLRQYKESPNL